MPLLTKEEIAMIAGENRIPATTQQLTAIQKKLDRFQYLLTDPEHVAAVNSHIDAAFAVAEATETSRKFIDIAYIREMNSRLIKAGLRCGRV